VENHPQKKITTAASRHTGNFRQDKFIPSPLAGFTFPFDSGEGKSCIQVPEL
jgi:hypothetical protein